jgi:hypothetical protein
MSTNTGSPNAIMPGEVEKWPVYAPLPVWARILGCSRDVLYHAHEMMYLKGNRVGKKKLYFTRTAILRWYAPSLLRAIEPGKEIV